MDKMIPKNIGTILLLAYNSGHLGFRFGSPAYKLLTNNNVIAADGTVATICRGNNLKEYLM